MSGQTNKFCTVCGIETPHWDNRVGKRNPKAPDYKCSICGSGIWQKPQTPRYGAPRPQKQVFKNEFKTPNNTKDASITAQALCKVKAMAGGYKLDGNINEQIYEDYVFFKERVREGENSADSVGFPQ